VISSLPWNGFGHRKTALFGHPYYLARSALRREIARAAEDAPHGPLLDVGCGTMPYRDLFPKKTPYECLEIDQPRNVGKSHVTHLYDGHSFNLPRENYGVVFSSQTLEHSFFPEEMLLECFGVLRPDGRLVLAMPFFWPEHEQPFDSQRFTTFGLIARLEAAGFNVRQVAKTNPGLSALVQLLIELIERPVRSGLAQVRSKWLRRSLAQLVRAALAFPYTILNIVGASARSVPRRDSSVEMYLDLVVVAEKPGYVT
jgi:SAM-dependent methyltransferase